MNQVCLVGRLTRDPRITTSTHQKTRASFTLAVDGIPGKDGKQTDFIAIAAWDKTAEIIGQYTHKGDRIGLTGRLHTWTREENGQSRYEMEVTADRIEFLSSAGGNTSMASSTQPDTRARDDRTSEGDEGLPF